MDATISYYSSNFTTVIRDDVRNTERVAKVSWLFRFLNWVQRYSIRNVERVYIQLHGLNEVVIQNPTKISQEDYEIISSAMEYFARLHSLYRKVDFMESDELKKISNDTLALGYAIEAKMKKAVHASKVRQLDNPELTSALAEYTKSALGNKIA